MIMKIRSDYYPIQHMTTIFNSPLLDIEVTLKERDCCITYTTQYLLNNSEKKYIDRKFPFRKCKNVED